MLKNYPFIRLSIITTCILYFSCINNSFSQGFSGINWYFGQNGTAVQFNKNDFEANSANNQHAPLGSGGSAMAVDPVTGNILFYTDGETIYDASGAPMAPGGVVLGGDPNSNQPVAISPVPGVEDNYYVFVNTGNGITSTSIDMSQQGNATSSGQPPLGQIIPPTIQSIYNGNINEGMIVIPGSNPDVFYLLVQDTNGDYKVFTIDNGMTISAPTTFSFPQGADITAANFNYNEATGQIAVSPGGPGEDVQILNFDPATGTLSFQETLAGTGAAGGVYDTEWSEDGTKLYISTLGAGNGSGNIFQYDFNEQPPLSTALLPDPVYASYGLKIGPDNKIYHLYQATENGPFLMGVINDPDSVASLIDYQANVFPGSKFDGKQFPEILPAETDECTVNFAAPATACQNATVSFLPTVNPSAESFSWDFGNGATSNQQSPNVIFEEPGTYNVSLEVECGGTTQTVSHPITITPNELQVNLQDTTMCTYPFTLTLEPETQGGEGGGLTYTWSNGDGTPSTDPNSPEITEPGFYWVVVTDPSTGCSVHGGATVKVYREENRIANIWYFGNGAGLDFNEEPTEAIEGPLNAPEGVAVISDPNGEVLFYTDGVTVWDRNDNQMPNGFDLGGGQNATQSSIIIPFPDDETLFYIFTPSELYGDGNFYLNYSIVDIKLNNGLGDVVQDQKGIPLFSLSTERITAIEGGPGYLLLAHDYGNNTFRVYPIGPNGIGNPVLSSIGSVHSTSTAAAGEGYMKFSSGGERIAVALPGPPNAVELFDFVDSTMKVTNYRRFELDADETPYGIEFSPSGDMLYVSVNNNGSGPSKLYQYALVDEDGEPIDEPVKVEVLSAPEAFGAIQIGSDGQVYMAVQGAGYLYQINGADNNHTINPVTPIQFPLQGTSTLGLPNFIQSLMQPPGDPTHEVEEGCVGQVTTFIGAPGMADIDKASWVVTQRSTGAVVFSSREFEDEFIFEEAGEYDVVFSVSNHCETDYYKTGEYYAYGEVEIPAILLVIEGPPDPPTIPESVAICEDFVTLEAAPEPATGLTFLWSTGDTTRTINVAEQSIVSVEITNDQGCTSEGETLVFDARPDLDLGEDAIYCQNDPSNELDTFLPGLEHVWTINGVPTSSTNRRQTVDTSVPGTFEYIVTVTNDEEFGGCVAKDTVVITVNSAPAFEISTQFSDCNVAEGIIEVVLDDPSSNYSYEWTDPDGNIVGTDFKVEDLSAGMYQVVVTDEETGCSRTESIPVNNNTDVVFDPTINHGCSGEGSIIFEITNATFPVDYQLHDMDNNMIIRSWRPSEAAPPITEDELDAGRYMLEIRSSDGCISFSDIIPLIASDSIAVEVPQSPISECTSEGNNVYFEVIGANTLEYNYVWTRDDGSLQGVEETNQDWITVNESGRYKVIVTDANPGNGEECPSTAFVEVEIFQEHTVNIIQEGDACEGMLTLRAEATPDTDTYSYQWHNGSLSQTIVINASETVSVNARSQRTGCVVGSGPIDFEVEPVALEVALNASTACEGAAFTLTATSNQSGVTFTYLNPDGVELATTTESELLVASDQPAGIYTVIAENDANGCTDEDRIVVSKLPAEEWVELPEEVTICTLDENPEVNSIELNPGGNFIAYRWRRPDGGTFLGQTLTATQPGLYIVTMETDQGCTFMDSTEVKVDCQPAIFGPNAFTPNDDMLNPTFRLHTRYISDFDIKIFNRWGELIFHDNKKDFEWDGTYRGKMVPNGTYPYLIRYRSAIDENGILELRGGVTVVK